MSKDIIISIGKAKQNWNYLVDINVSNVIDKKQSHKYIQKICDIIVQYRKSLSGNAITSDVRNMICTSMPYFYNMLGRLYSSKDDVNHALDIFSASFVFQKENNVLSFDLMVEYLDFLMNNTESDSIYEVVNSFTVSLFSDEGYDSAMSLYRKLSKLEDPHEKIKSKLLEMKFLLGLMVPHEISYEKYAVFLLEKRVFNFFHPFLNALTAEKIKSIPVSGDYSLISILQHLDRLQPSDEPHLNFEEFYQRVDAYVFSSGNICAISSYLSFLQENNMVIRRNEVERKIQNL